MLQCSPASLQQVQSCRKIATAVHQPDCCHRGRLLPAQAVQARLRSNSSASSTHQPRRLQHCCSSSTDTAVTDGQTTSAASVAEPNDDVNDGGNNSGSTTSSSSAAPLELVVSLASGMKHVGREEWDACAKSGSEVNPFLLWDFLHVLEDSGSAVREEGWLPQHMLVRRGDTGELLGCAAMYLKAHSYGEYVFDQSWANAYMRMLGRDYYPKLLVGVPFTPVPGPRLLVKPGPQAAAVRRALADTLKQVADQFGVSSLHINFCTEEEYDLLGGSHGYLQRLGIQYHWHNDASRGSSIDSSSSYDETSSSGGGGSSKYSSFDEGDGSFLMNLRQSKRKSIRQERKKAAQEGLRFLRLTGSDIKPHHWDAFYKFYQNTTDRKWGSAYLTRKFFTQLGERMGDKVLLVLAETEEGEPGQGKPIAGALNLIGSHALFGRNWGCLYGDRIQNLHFELCYYQALEEAIERGLDRVEAGAQGEHKLQRGYLPSLTYSVHYLPDPNFSAVVERYLYQEREEMKFTMRMLAEQATPYKA